MWDAHAQRHPVLIHNGKCMRIIIIIIIINISALFVVRSYDSSTSFNSLYSA